MMQLELQKKFCESYEQWSFKHDQPHQRFFFHTYGPGMLGMQQKTACNYMEPSHQITVGFLYQAAVRKCMVWNRETTRSKIRRFFGGFDRVLRIRTVFNGFSVPELPNVNFWFDVRAPNVATSNFNCTWVFIALLSINKHWSTSMVIGNFTGSYLGTELPRNHSYTGR